MYSINQSLFVVITLSLTSAYYAPYPYTWPVYYVQYPYVPCCYPVIQEIVVECEMPEQEGPKTTGASVVTIKPSVTQDPTETSTLDETNSDISGTTFKLSTSLDLTTNEVTDQPITSTTEYSVTDEFITTMVSSIFMEVSTTSPQTEATIEFVSEDYFSTSSAPLETTIQTGASSQDPTTTEVSETDQPLNNSTTEDPVSDEFTTITEFASNGDFSESTAPLEIASTQGPSNSNTPSYFPEVDPQ